MKVQLFVTGCLLVAVLAGCGSASAGRLGAAQVTQVTQVTSSPSLSPSPVGSQARDAVTLPAGWRWESYRGTVVGVPGAWGYGTTDEPWCLNREKGTERKPYVGRPGPVAAIGCVSPNHDSDPSTLVKTAGTFVWLGGPDSTGSTGGTGGRARALGDRQTLTMDGVVVEVQASAELRRRIVATIHRVTTDQHGCAADYLPIRRRNWRPARGFPVDDLIGVRSVAACKYDFADGRLAGSVGLNGPTAARAVAAVAAAPEGGGPNDAASCSEDVEYGDQIIVLLVEAAQGRREIALRFDGCDHHGFDDGSTVRTLTRTAVAPFVAGSNQVLAYSGVLGGVLSPGN